MRPAKGCARNHDRARSVGLEDRLAITTRPATTDTTPPTNIQCWALCGYHQVKVGSVRAAHASTTSCVPQVTSAASMGRDDDGKIDWNRTWKLAKMAFKTVLNTGQ
jgi:hypothetical protein